MPLYAHVCVRACAIMWARAGVEGGTVGAESWGGGIQKGQIYERLQMTNQY